MSVAVVVVGILLAVGGVFCVLGGIGLVRFPDLYSRFHASGLTDTMGAMLVVGGCMTWAAIGDGGWLLAVADGDTGALLDGVLMTFKLLSILFFMWVSGTTAVHALAKAAWLDGVRPWTADDEDGAPSTR